LAVPCHNPSRRKP